MRASSCCCCCSFWLRMLKLLMPGPPHTARGYCFSLSFAPAWPAVFFWIFICPSFFDCPSDWFWFTFDPFPDIDSSFSFFSLLSKKNKTKHKFRNFPCVCVLVLFLFFFCLAASAILFFNLFFSPPLSVCVAYSSYFSIFWFYFPLRGGFLSSFLVVSWTWWPSDYEEEEDDGDLEFIDASYPKRASLPFVSPLPLRCKAVQRQLSVD